MGAYLKSLGWNISRQIRRENRNMEIVIGTTLFGATLGLLFGLYLITRLQS